MGIAINRTSVKLTIFYDVYFIWNLTVNIIPWTKLNIVLLQEFINYCHNTCQLGIAKQLLFCWLGFKLVH